MFHSKNGTFLIYDPFSEFNPFIDPFHKTQSFFMAQRIVFFFSKNHALKNWTFFLHDSKNDFFWHDSKNWTFFWTYDLQELNPFVKYDSKNWTFFFLQKKSTQRMELFKNDSKNWTFVSFQFDSKNCNFFMTQRIEPSFWTCFNELNLFLFDVTQGIEPFLDMTQRIELSFLHLSKAWALLHDSKTWSFL